MPLPLPTGCTNPTDRLRLPTYPIMLSDKFLRALLSLGLSFILVYIISVLYDGLSNGLPWDAWPAWYFYGMVLAVASALGMTLFNRPAK